MTNPARRFTIASVLALVSGGAPVDAQPARLRVSDIDTITLNHSATRVAYGTDSLQFGELRLPSGRGPFPVAVLIHGGCYFSKYATLRNTAALADALTSAGVATWNIEYRRYDNPGGGWPGTFTDAANATDYLRVLAKLHPLDLSRVITMGHSAGGQLALWLAAKAPTAGTAGNAGNTRNAATSSAQNHTPSLRGTSPLQPVGVVALGPITDMQEYQTREKASCGNAAIESVLGGLPSEVPDRVAIVSPIARLPLGVPTALVAGDRDGIATAASLNSYASAARLKGDRVQIFTSPGDGHFDVLAPFRASGQAALSQAKAMLGVP